MTSPSPSPSPDSVADALCEGRDPIITSLYEQGYTLHHESRWDPDLRIHMLLTFTRSGSRDSTVRVVILPKDPPYSDDAFIVRTIIDKEITLP